MMKKLKLIRDRQKVYERLRQLRLIAREHEWKEQFYQDKTGLMRFKRDEEKMIDVWTTTMKLATYEMKDVEGKIKFSPTYHMPKSEDEIIELFITY